MKGEEFINVSTWNFRFFFNNLAYCWLDMNACEHSLCEKYALKNASMKYAHTQTEICTMEYERLKIP